MENQATAFTLAVVRTVKRIPRGKVATYGQIARLAGNDHGARAVGWILHAKARAETLPWQRVINRAGKISFHEGTREYAKQRRLLENEGIKFDRTGTVDLELFGWKAKRNA